MQIEDILKAAIQDSGLDANMQMHTGCISNSQSSNEIVTNQFDASYYANNEVNQNTELLLSDLDFSLLGNESSYSSTSINNQACSNSILTDDNDPFLIALKQLDEQNKPKGVDADKDNELSVKIDSEVNNSNDVYGNNYKTNTNYNYTPYNPLSDANYQPRKIIKLNLSSNGTTSSTQGLMTQTLTSIKTQPIVRVISSNNSQQSVDSNVNKSSSNDLISLINFRNNFQQSPVSSMVKGIDSTSISGQASENSQHYPITTIKYTNFSSTNITNNNINNPSSTNLLDVKNSQGNTSSNSNNLKIGNHLKTLQTNSIKVINLTQLQQQQQKEKLASSNNKIIQLNNSNINTNTFNLNQVTSVNNIGNKSDQTPSSTTTTTATNPNTNTNTNSNNSNTIQITKVVSSRGQFTSNGITGVETNNLIYYNKNNNQLVPISQSSNSTFINRNPLATATCKTIPKFYTTSKMFAAHYVNNNSQNVTSHLSNKNPYLSQSNNMTSHNTNTVTINPKYAMNTNTNHNVNNSQQMISQINNIHHLNNNVNNNYLPNNYYQNIAEPDEEVVVEEEEELGHAETYANYMPTKLNLGTHHPDPIVETSSLASVEPPDVKYKLKMSESVYSEGQLSALQLEAIVYSCQKHQDFLPNNHRCGFLIGDGAGVGKGRTIAGCIYENYLWGRKKALWLSVSNDLKFDAQRDFSDIGANKIQVHSLNKLKYCKISSKQNSKIKKGVIFATYSSLIGESQQKATKKKYNSRLKQLLQWLGGDSFDGVIVFDECHKAKNLVPCGSAKPTKTGLAVLELQEKLPNARIIYASATGASEPKNMAYMVRLGLWGRGTPFVDFNDFIQSMEKRGIGAMEIVAMDMKLRGMYMARQLSFSGVSFKIEEIKLKNEYVKMYDDAVKLWVDMKEKFQEALELIDPESNKQKKTVWGQFWSSHQRFFKYLCMACKVPYVVELARKAISSNKCVVIGLQSTGEARTLEQLDEFGEINEFVSTAKSVIQNLVEKHFPSTEITLPGKSLSNSSSNKIANKNFQNNNKSFLDILGVGDNVRQQIDKNVRTKESKNTQKVNDILQRLSSYTNNTNNGTNDSIKNSLNKKHKRKNYRSSSMSSSSSIASSADSHASSKTKISSCDLNDENNDPLESEIGSEDDDDDDSEFNSSMFDSFSDEVNEADIEEPEDFLEAKPQIDQIGQKPQKTKNYDTDDPFNMCEMFNSDADPFDFHFKSDQNDSGISLNSINTFKKEPFDYFDSIKTEQSIKSENKDGFESDDSDCLFSITKSVPIQSLINNTCKKKVRLTSEQRKKRLKESHKRKKNGVNVKNIFHENEDDEDEDIHDLEENKNCHEENKYSSTISNDLIKSDDEFSNLIKRPKIESSDPNEFKLTTTESCAVRPKIKPVTPNEISEYIYSLKRDLLNSIDKLGRRLPPNTLDELIDLLDGPDNVAEMTGRKGRVVQSGDKSLGTSSYVYEGRNETDVPLELLNVVQKERFMNGEKLVAIISEAASSGISLQANRRYANQCRRVHITIELPWSADRAIQQFGRTHRSNQVSAPEYIFLISELAGEKRFASTVAKRLESLGALTHGDRRATESRDLSRFNIDNKYGRSALENVIKSICGLEKPMTKFPKTYKGDFLTDAKEAMNGVGLIYFNKISGTAYPEKDYNNINKFLNRLLGVTVQLQNAIFTFFSDVLSAVILEAKRTGKWDMGILDLGSNNEIAFRKETKFYILNNDPSKKVEMHTIMVERGLSWEKAFEIYKQNVKVEDENSEKNLPADGFYVYNQIKNNHRIPILVISAHLISSSVDNSKSLLSIYRPNTGLQVRQETFETLVKKYKRINPTEIKSDWEEQFHKSATQCTHIFRQAHCSNFRSCEIGLRTRKFHVLAGSVLTVWSKVENKLSEIINQPQFRLQIIRVKTNDDRKIIGCVIPSRCLNQISSLLELISKQTNSICDNDCIIEEEFAYKSNLNKNTQGGNTIDTSNLSINKLEDFHSKNVFNFNLPNDKSFKNVSNQILNCDFT